MFDVVVLLSLLIGLLFVVFVFMCLLWLLPLSHFRTVVNGRNILTAPVCISGLH